jgi:hypothetical protein
MRVEVNDHVVWESQLSVEPTISGVDIPLSDYDMKVGHVKLTVRASIMPSDVKCFDERKFALHYIHILPESRVELTGIPQEIKTLRGVWSVMPKDVILSMPANPTPDIMRVVLQAAAHLKISGKTVGFTKLPALGDVVVAERAELNKWLATVPGANRTQFDDHANISVIQHAGKGAFSNITVITEAATDRDLQLIGRDWRKLTLEGDYIDVTPAGQDARLNRSFTFGEMGVNDEPRSIARTATWQFFAGIPQVPGDMRIKALNVNVIGPPSSDRQDERLLLFVYVNNILQEVQPVANTGKTQTIKFNIANYSQWLGRNYIKIMAQRFSPRECVNTLATYKMQILRDSTIEFEHFAKKPRIFNDLHAYFAQGFDLYMTPEGMSPKNLHLLMTLLSDQKYDLTNMKVKAFDSTVPFKPTGPFMLFGRPRGAADARGISNVISMDDQTVHFDRGDIEVQTTDTRVLLAVKKLPGISISQVVEHNGYGGLWVAPTEDDAYPEMREYFLEQGDTSFADPKGEVLNMKTRQMNRAKVEYPEYLDVFGKLGRYRFWIVALGWMVIGFVLVLIYRRIQQYQKETK